MEDDGIYGYGGNLTIDESSEVAGAKVEEDLAAYVASFRQLHVYREAMRLAREVFLVSRNFPKEETYSMTDQIRRSSRAISANIAEAWAKREYEPHFISKLSDSLAETYETQAWLDHAVSCDYLTPDQFAVIDPICHFVAAMLRNTSAKSASFCGKLPRPPTSHS